jgi:uncharacterized protein (TIGR00299 family) protein
MKEAFYIHLDAVGGVAGDMFVAAMLDAFPDLRIRVFDDLHATLPMGCGTPVLSEGLSSGMSVRRFVLDTGASNTPMHRQHGDPHHHHHHDINHPEQESHYHHGETHGRGAAFADLVDRIVSAPLHAGTAEHAIAILRRLAEAESRMHRVTVDEVHFHEIGDWDSLMDVVAAGSIIAALPGASWSVSDLPRGHGLVATQHGLLPVPAPATLELLRGFRWRDDGIGGERVTPTGAAILAHVVEPTPPRRSGMLHCAGTGAGTRELSNMPNILRVSVFAIDDVATPLQANQDEVIVLAFDIDDMTGEEVGIAIDRLRCAEGVLDVSIGSRQGKKGRPVHDFRLLLKPQVLSKVSELCFIETSTIGLRWHHASRICLQRSGETIAASGKILQRKRVRRPDGTASFKVESDDVADFGGLVQRRGIARVVEHDKENA